MPTFGQDLSAKNGDRWIVTSVTVDHDAWQVMVDRLGWQIYVTNLPDDACWDVTKIVHLYRQQPHIENSMSYLKSRYLHIRPIFVRRSERIIGLTWLLILALRLITLIEFRVRRQLHAFDQFLMGLKPSSPSFKTQTPTTKKMLEAFEGLDWVSFEIAGQTHFHMAPLTDVQKQVLTLLQIPFDIYTQLNTIHYKPLFNLRE